MTTDCLRLATERDMRAILHLIDAAARWLRGKDTDQWAQPWPDRDARDERVAQGIRHRDTWVLERGRMLAGTVTYRGLGNEKLWSPGELAEPAVYVSRLVIDRKAAGQGTGAALLDWAGLRGAKEWGANSIRIDVWTDNHDLHAYYERQGFHHVRTCDFKDRWEYPSAALFQKPAGGIDPAVAGRFCVKESRKGHAPFTWQRALRRFPS